MDADSLAKYSVREPKAKIWKFDGSRRGDWSRGISYETLKKFTAIANSTSDIQKLDINCSG